MTKERRPSIKDEERYEAVRQDGVGKEKAARIANTAPQEMERPAASGAYEAWTKEELYEKARDVGVEGRSKMTKDELIEALRG